MNKRAITLISVFILLVSTQLACSLNNVLENLGQGAAQAASPEVLSQVNQDSQIGNDQVETSYQESSHPAASQTECTKSFSASTTISEGQEFQAGDVIQAQITLLNTGSCTWDIGYSLIEMGGDLSPSSSSLVLSTEVAEGDSVLLQVSYTAPSQSGPYLSIWKMQDADGGVFGQNDPPDAPLRIKIRVIPSGNPQPTPSPTPNSQTAGNQFTMLDDECFDFNSGAVVDCSDSSADFKYAPDHPVFGELTRYNDNTFGENHTNEPDVNTCQNDSYAPMPHFIEANEYLCFKIETLASTTYGWMRVTHYNEDGLTFDFDLIGSSASLVTTVPNTNLFVESQGQQITLLEGECYDVWNGQKNSSCSGTFAGFLFEEVTKKSLQVSQITPNEMYFSAAMSSEPTKSDCTSASYSTTPIWPIQATSYYCYQFVPGTTAYYGWLRPTSFNLSGITFDYLTWQIIQ